MGTAAEATVENDGLQRRVHLSTLATSASANHSDYTESRDKSTEKETLDHASCATSFDPFCIHRLRKSTEKVGGKKRYKISE
jgi:hypothetical protein